MSAELPETSQTDSSVINQTSANYCEEFLKLTPKALMVIESALRCTDEKIKTETAKWVISENLNLRDRPSKSDKGSSVTEGSNLFLVQNLNIQMDKLKHIAEGAKKLEHAQYKILNSAERSAIHREGDDEDGF